MFTGLVEHVGRVVRLDPNDDSSSGGGGVSLTVGDAAEILDDCKLGDSICVNGACLTVTDFSTTEQGGRFKVGLAPETLERTDLGDLKPGSGVNLERAMAPGGRYGGHVVQGHVDTTVKVVSVTPDGNSLRFVFALAPASPPSHLHSLIPKGYVTLDGTSLTLTSVSPSDRTFGVMLIAHTQERVVLTKKKPGDRVNVEFDVVAKGVESIVSNILSGSSSSDGQGSAFEELVDRAVERALARRGVLK